MPDNPYASPAFTPEPIPAADVLHPSQLPIATKGKRFVNLIIDNIIIRILAFASGFVLGIIYFGANGGNATPDDELTVNIISFMLGLAVAVGYFVLTEGLLQRSVGKFVTGTMVVNSKGQRPTFGQILGRSCARLIPFEAFSFLSGTHPVGWHDSLSGTRVIMMR